jgi:uncharacterized protein (TIGR02217 family)
MSTQVFPALLGLGWDIVRAPVWTGSSTVQQAASGKETVVSRWTYPRWRWDLSFDFLRSDVDHAELQALVGFFNARLGNADSFVYEDQDDNSITGQVLSTGDGTTKSFQLVRAFGAFVEPVLAPKSIANIYLDDVAQDPGDYSLTGWGTSTPGVLTFASAPTSGAVVSADFAYRFPVRFQDDTIDFTKFMSTLYRAGKVTLLSKK